MQIFEKFGLISRKFCKGNILLTLNKILQLTRKDGAEFSGVTNELHAKRPSPSVWFLFFAGYYHYVAGSPS